MLPGLTVVISPLISLMKDQVDALVKRGIAATFVNSSLGSGEISDRNEPSHARRGPSCSTWRRSDSGSADWPSGSAGSGGRRVAAGGGRGPLHQRVGS